jgi:diguanylate cyclase (GGDEF)-like protein/PAS domain S-box-containing protein
MALKGVSPAAGMSRTALSPAEPAAGIVADFAGHGFWRLEATPRRITWWDGVVRRDAPVVFDRAGREALRRLVHPEDLPGLDARVTRAFTDGADFAYDLRLRRADGTWRLVSSRGTAQTDVSGAVVALMGVLMDVTEVEICRILSEQGNDIITQSDRSGTMTYVSPSVEKVTGYTPVELVGRPISDLLGRDTASAIECAVREILADPGRRPPTVEYKTQHKNGRDIWLESQLTPMVDPLSGDRVGLTDVVREVTDRKLAETRLEHAHILLKTLMESSPSGIILVDADRRIISYNHKFADMWNVSTEVMEGGDFRQILAHASDLIKDDPTAPEQARGIMPDSNLDAQHEIETTDGRWIERHTVPVRTPGDGPVGWAWFFRDVTKQRRVLTEAVRMARYDHLTGLANRAALFEWLQRSIARGRERDEGFAIFCLDLDNFKDVNDTLGHLIGDQLLVSVADRLGRLVRDADLVSRPGGDEFAIVAAGIRTATEAAMLADRFIREVSAPYLIDGHQIYTSVSIGIELFGRGIVDERSLLSHADMALYQAKAAGAGTYRFFTEVMDTEVRTRVTLGAELRDAIASGQLFLVYQPEVELTTGRIIGAEALVRWRHPRRGVLGPDLFIPVAEQMGLIGALGRWVLWTAARQARAWADTGLAGIRMGVNVSALQFKAPAALEADIAAVLAETGLSPALLELELTETALMTASEGGDILMRLHQSGVRIAIDDFGTGYSSLDYLRRFPAGRIKIAQTFVRHLGARAGEAAIVKATIGLARELGMTVIAEGVETRNQLEMLKAWGCGEGQGYIFDRPLGVEAATARLRAGRYALDAIVERLPLAEPRREDRAAKGGAARTAGAPP